MTRETAKRLLKIYPLIKRSEAQEDIDEKAFITKEIIPVFEIDGNCYQFTVDYKIKLDDGYIYGRTESIEKFAMLHGSAQKGRKFTVTYTEKSRLILEIEETE